MGKLPVLSYKVNYQKVLNLMKNDPKTATMRIAVVAPLVVVFAIVLAACAMLALPVGIAASHVMKAMGLGDWEEPIDPDSELTYEEKYPQVSRVGKRKAVKVPTYETWTDPLPKSDAFATIDEIMSKRVMIIDGAMGTSVQAYKLKEEDFRPF